MKILDGLPKNEAEMKDVLAIAKRVSRDMISTRRLSPRHKSMVTLVEEGLSVADICNITREERDAILALGCRHLQVGEYDKARDILTWLLRLEPTDERVAYALGAVQQASGRYVEAGRCYLAFMALDATNPEGFLRLGECFFGNREYEAARGCFEGAKVLVGQGHGKPAAVVHAERMIALLENRSSAPAA